MPHSTNIERHPLKRIEVVAAVLYDEQRSVMVGLQNVEVVYVPLTKAIKQKKDIKDDKWQALQVLSI